VSPANSYAPGQGQTQPTSKYPTSTQSGKKSASDGSNRQNVGFDKDGGIRVTLRAEKGVTADGILKTPFRFQCPPLNEFTRPLLAPWNPFETLSAREQSRPQGASLRQWQFDTLFVWDNEPFVVWKGTDQRPANAKNGFFEPQAFIAELEAIAEANGIFRLLADEPKIWSKPIVNSLATLTGVSPTQKAGEIGTEYVTVTFQQYRELTADGTRRARSGSTPGAGSSGGSGGPSPGHGAGVMPVAYRVLSTDSLYDVARKQMGSPSDWRNVAALNGITNVSASDAGQLQAWMQAHHKTTLLLPPKVKHSSTPSAAGQ
jgi:hypothetical protein